MSFVKSRPPENIDTLGPREKKAAKELLRNHLQYTLWNTGPKESPDLNHTFGYQDTVSGQGLGLIGTVFDDGEPHIQRPLDDLTSEDAWKTVVGQDDDGSPRIPCLLRYSQSGFKRQGNIQRAKLKFLDREAEILEERNLQERCGT